MEISKVGQRGVLFSFDDETAVYLINSDTRVFLCDTHLGPDSMDIVKGYIHDHGWTNKELIVFNSHSDWDHIWGNCAFENHVIIGHAACRERMLERAQYELDVIPEEFRKGKVYIKLPNITFKNSIKYEDDDIEFIYAPGHTVCSSICFDKRDSVIYSGDLIERPMPYTMYYNLEDFLNSLELIKEMHAKTVVTAHSGIADEKLIEDNITYIKSILSGTTVTFDDEGALQMHENNLKRVLILKYEKVIKQKMKDKFDYRSYKLDFWRFMKKPEETITKEYINMKSTSYEDLETGLIDYIATI